jgi:hypothetical protein
MTKLGVPDVRAVVRLRPEAGGRGAEGLSQRIGVVIDLDDAHFSGWFMTEGHRIEPDCPTEVGLAFLDPSAFAGRLDEGTTLQLRDVGVIGQATITTVVNRQLRREVPERVSAGRH